MKIHLMVFHVSGQVALIRNISIGERVSEAEAEEEEEEEEDVADKENRPEWGE